MPSDQQPPRPRRGFAIGGRPPGDAQQLRRGFAVSGRPKADDADDTGTDERVNKRTAFGALMRVGTDAAVGALTSLFAGVRRGEIARDPAARRRQMARMGASVGRTMGAAKLGSIGRSDEARDQIRRRAAEQATEQVVAALGNMKGLAMKFGQLMSYAATLSDDAERQLAALQATSEPMPYDAVAHVVTTELGRAPEEAFAVFDIEPVAAASVGQVHRATLHDGTEVAVKVQYPGVEDAILSDLANMTELSNLAALGGGKVEFRPIYDEIATLVREELDYVAEAASQAAFADAYRGHPFVKIPEVYPELSSARVLTTEFVTGRTLYDLADRPAAVRDAYGEIIYRFAFGSVLSGSFSGDPHPGNYIFCDDGRVCFLDFGLVKRLDAEQAEGIRALARAAAAGDDRAISGALEAIGLAAEGVDPAGLWDELGPCALGPVGLDRPHRLTRQGQQDALRAMQNPEGEFTKLWRSSYPPSWLSMFYRYGFGTVAVISRLEAEANWHRILSELAGSESASTEIGERWGEGSRA